MPPTVAHCGGAHRRVESVDFVGRNDGRPAVKAPDAPVAAAAAEVLLIPPSLIREVVSINSLQLVRCVGPDADAVVDHEFRELCAANEDHLRVDPAGVVDRLPLENEDVVMKTPFLARLPCKAPANLWTSGRPTVLSHRLAWM